MITPDNATVTRADVTAWTLADVLEYAAAQWGERVALVDGERRCTYSELRRRARDAAGGFARIGIRKGDRVAIWLPNSLEWVVAFFGAIYAGATVVALNTALSAKEIEYQVAQSGASLLIACSAYRNRDYLAEARQLRTGVGDHLRLVGVDHAGDADITSWAQLTRLTEHEVQLPSVDVTDPAIMLYTSGTTGRPKGAVHTHSFVATLFAGVDHLEMCETDVAVLYLPLFHILALVAGLVMLSLAGARTVLMARFDATTSLRLIRDEKATIIYGIPTTYIDQLNNPLIDDIDFSGVRFAFTSLAPDLCRKVHDKTGVKCLNPYGMTETAALVMVAGLDDPPEIAVGTVGRPLAGMAAKVVDDTTGLPVPHGESGALLMRGPSILWKYHDLPEATAAAFDDEGWFRTGDLASMDAAGNITFIGRQGDGYRVGGELVDPVEVEAAIQSHPDVLRAAALGVPDERLGEVGHAWVHVRAEAAATEPELLTHVTGLLASFKVPRRIHIVSELPTNPSGKVQKFRLRDTLTAGNA
ncbi:fatty-acyl-CoA synthase [Nocardia sp. GAS34]|uniref:class I adenylate-forming enzyme family protein n=1 Tax=unclassified Nocardia TaxID=2637762 RepID=UPI003D1F6010